MRISTGYQFQAMSTRISDAQSSLFEAQQRVLTGKRFEKASEDPLSSRLVIGVNGLKSRLEGLSHNIRAAKERSGLVETAAGEIGSILTSARQLGIQGNSSALTQEARLSLASQLESLKSRLVSTGNTRDAEGAYIFAGQSTSTKPFSTSPAGAVSFVGDDLPLMAELRPGEKTRINAAGAGDLIARIAAQIDDLKSGVLGGQAGDALAAIESSQKQVLDLRGENANLMNLVQRLEESQAKRIDDLTVQASDLQEIDLTTAMTEFQRAQTAYEASLRVTSTASQLSLMDFLR